MPKKLTIEEFLLRAEKIHGKKYDYSLVQIINSRTTVKIICPLHGVFEQRPVYHITSKCQCPKCGYIQNSKKRMKYNTETFIQKANEVHNFSYIYSKSIYTQTEAPIIIICPRHGEFIQTPYKHLRGGGCPKCFAYGSKNEKKIIWFFEEKNLEYQYQKRFSDLIYPNSKNRKISFDFYLEKFNLLIEFDGRQHFGPYSFKTNSTNEEKIKNFQKTQYFDFLRDEYCKNTNKNLLRISYLDDPILKIKEYLLHHYNYKL